MNGTGTGLRRAVVVMLALSLLVAGCGRFARSGSVAPEPSSTEKVTYGGGLASKTPKAVRTLSKNGTLRIRLIDDTNRPIAGAIVRYRGPKNGQAATDSRGVARVSVPSGNYEASVAPCGTRVVTKDYREASLFVPRGGTAGGDLDQIRWERRFQPTSSAQAKPEAPWKVGSTVDLAIRIEDRCTYSLARNTPIPEYGWNVTSPYALRKAPIMRSSADGFAHISITCKAEGNGTVEIFDRTFPKKRVNAITPLPVPYGGKYCES